MFFFMRNTIINRRFKYNDINATSILIIINVVVFILQNVFTKLPYVLSMVPIYIRLKHWYWQFFTYMFSHVDFWHLFSNMLGLYIFGRIVERSVGSKEFLLYYLSTGTLAGVASYFVYLYSGSLFIPMRAPILVIIYFFIDFFGQFRADGTAHLVHLTGLLFGLLYIIIRMRINPLKQWGVMR